MFNVTIDNKKVTAENTMTILDVARQNGIHIPTLCHIEGIHDNHSCRLCVVEIEGARILQPACGTKVADGMVIRTDSEKVVDARKNIVNILLSTGEHNCISCESNGDCELQNAAYSLGIDAPKFNIKKSEGAMQVDSSSEMIVRDNKKCILCRRCVIACNDIVVNDVLGMGFRGSDTVVVCDNDKPMGESSCVQCGECVQKCPVGALTEKKSLGMARTWETKKVRTTCPYCGVGCQMYLHMKGDQIVRVTGVEDAQPNKGSLCVKGRFGYDFIYSKERLTKPLIKENGKFREASWDEALDLVASKFKEIISKYGPDAVAGISSARSINEDSYNMQKLFRAVFKSRNIDHCARSCHAPTVAGLLTSFGTGGMTNSIQEIEKTKLIFAIGTNMTEAHPVVSYFVKKAAKNGVKLIVADPRKHKLADHADIFAQIKVGSDVAFLNGIMYILITENLYDKEFVAAHCENFEAFKEEVMSYSPQRAAEISGVSEETIVEIARMLGTIKPAMAFYTLGITEHTCGKNNVMSVANLQMLLGNIGKPYAGVNPLRGQNNVQGACDMGALPNQLPGYQKVVDSAAREKFAKAWEVDSIPETPGIMIPEMIEGLANKQIRALYVFGQNIVGTEPNIKRIEECMEAGEFIVCNDLFETETTKFAHVVLPAAAWCEDDGTFTNCERRINRVRKVKNPPGEAKPNWWIFKEIAKRFGHEWTSNSSQEIWDNEFSVLSPQFAGVKYHRLQEDGIQWPCYDLEHIGTQILHKDGNFTHGKGKFQALKWTPPAEVPDEEYPFVLSTGRRLYHYHTRTQTGRCKGLNELLPEEYADISVDDAQRLGINDGDKVIVKSRRGEVKVTARVSERIAKGLVWMAFHFREGNSNWITNMAYDPETHTAEYKACAVNVIKI
jgi:formate dehydrogenase alpha subunit